MGMVKWCVLAEEIDVQIYRVSAVGSFVFGEEKLLTVGFGGAAVFLRGGFLVLGLGRQSDWIEDAELKASDTLLAVGV